MDENWFCVEKQTIQYMPQSFKQTKKAYLEHWTTNMIFVKRFYAEKPEPDKKQNLILSTNKNIRIAKKYH